MAIEEPKVTRETGGGTGGRRGFWVRLDRFMRSTHLYSGLFLVPWMMVYATSALLINHGEAVRSWFRLEPMRPQRIRQVTLPGDLTFEGQWSDQAKAVLAHVGLEGGYRVMPAQSNARQLKIMRICALGNYVVTWNRPQHTITIDQQQPFSTLRLINFLHFKGGYGQPYPAHLAWAMIVDLVALSLVFWVISGIYLWARRPSRRLLGGVFFMAGGFVFVLLVAALCQ